MRIAFFALFAAGAFLAPVIVYRLVGRGRRPWLLFPALLAYLAGAYVSRIFIGGALGPTVGGLLAATVFGLVLYRRLGHAPQNVPRGAGASEMCAVCKNPIVVSASGKSCPVCRQFFHAACIADHLCRSV